MIELREEGVQGFPRRARRALAIFSMLGVLSPAVRGSAAVVVRVSTDDALPGGTVTLRMAVESSAGDPAIAGLQADLILNTDQFDLVGACSSDQSVCANGSTCPEQGRCVPSCTKDGRLIDHSLVAAYPDFQNVGLTQRRLRLPINPDSFPPASFDPGALVVCTFQARPGAALGAISLTADLARFRVTDPAADPINATLSLEPGAIVDTLATVTPTPTEPEPTATAPIETPTEVPATATLTPEVTETETLTPVPESTATPTTPPTATETIPPVPTNTAPVATATTVVTTAPTATVTTIPATSTATVAVPTATVTQVVAATATSPAATATVNPGSSNGSDGGCSVAGVNSSSSPGVLSLLWPLAIVLYARRRNCR